MEIIRQILNLLLLRRYQMTEHALESMDEDDLSLNDVLSCLATGRLHRSWPRQRKLEIEGLGSDGRRIRVVARLLSSREARIITIYEIN